MGFLIQTAILFLVLYFFPILGVLQDEAKLAFAAGISVLLSACLTFAWELIAAPPRLYDELEAEAEKLRDVVSTLFASEEARRRLSKLYAEGCEIYQKDFEMIHFPQWRAEMDQWIQTVRTELLEHWTVSSVHHFDDASLSGNFSRMRIRNNPSVEEIEKEHGIFVLGAYTSRLIAVNDIIRSRDENYIGEYLRVRDAAAGSFRKSDDVGADRRQALHHESR